MVSKTLDARLGWIPHVASAGEIQPGHRARLAGLSSQSGFPLCAAPLPVSTKARHAQNTSPSPPVASSSKWNGDSKSKRSNVIPISISDTEEESEADPIASFSDVDELEVEKPKPTDCNKRKCDNNPNCLKWTGQALWDDKDKALESFLKSPLLGPNPMDRSRTPGVPVGLKLGATCYAAALLQTWFHNHRFRNAVYRLATALELDQTLQTSPTHQLQTVFYGLQHSSLSAWDPKGLVESLELNEDQQQDAQEFSKLFMSMLASEFAKQEDEDLKSLVEDQFEGGLSYTTECKGCKTKSDRPSKFLELELNMTPNAKLEERLGALLAAEELSGDNQYLCGQCDSLQDATRRIELTSLPPILHFSLLRFVFDPETFSRKKSKSVIKYPASIDMAQFLAPPSPAKGKGKGKGKENGHAEAVDAEGTIYDLRGILLHKGGSAYSGHYCAEVYNAEDDKWYSCDDESVSEISSRTPPRTDKPFRPVVDSTAKPGKIDSYFDKTPKPKPAPSQLAKGGQKDTPWAVSDDEPEDTVLMGRTRAGKTVPLAATKRSANADSPDEQTPRAKKARLASSSPEVEAKPPPYHASKDAYMLVYARREPPSSPPSPSGRATHSPPVSYDPPREVIEAIESVNVAHQADCAEWEARQTAMVSAFEEVFEKKKAVFDTWQIKDFSEPSFLVDKSALAAWTTQGLKVKSTKKPIVDTTVIDVDASPDDAPQTNGSRPPASSPARPPSDPNGSSAQEGVDVAMSAGDDVAPAAPEVALAEEDVKVEERVEASAVREVAIKQACETVFSNDSLLCPHGAINPRPSGPVSFKRISSAAVELMQSSLGCRFQPPLAVDTEAVCGACTTEVWRDKTYRASRRKHLDTFNDLNDIETNRACYVTSKNWYNDYTTGAVPAFFDPANETDPLPTEGAYKPDLVCAHDGKATNAAGRQKLISPEAYKFLQTIFPGLELWRFDDDRCPVCQAQDFQREEDGRPAKEQAEKERSILPGVCKSLKTILSHEEYQLETNYAVVDPEFMRAWAQWSKNPTKTERPTRMETGQYFCEHGLVDFDVENKHDRKETRFAVIEADDYDQFASWYETGRRISFIFEEELVHGKIHAAAMMDPSPCVDCRRARKKDFKDGFIRAHIIAAKDDPRLPGNKDKGKAREPSRSVSPPVRGAGLPQPTRQSARTRQAATAGKKNIQRIDISPDTTVKDFKVQLASRLKTSVLHLSLRKDDIDVDDNSKLLCQVDCVPGDLVEVIQLDDDGNQDEDAWLNNSDNDDDVRPGRVEAGSGFGGTRLGGGGGGSSRAAPASSPALNGNGRRSESVTAASSSKEEEWEVIPSDGDVPMADPVGEENRMKSCPTCTFANNAALKTCEMCDTALPRRAAIPLGPSSSLSP